jgi:2-haloacid dehalogenase
MPGVHVPALVRDAAASRRREILSWQVALADGSAIEAVVFDAYGTLFDLTSLTTACRDLVSEAAAFVAQWRAKQLKYSWLRALMGNYADFAQVTRDALEFTLTHFAIDADDETVRALLAAWLTLEPYPEVTEMLAQLKGHPLAILSNGSPAMLAAALKHAKLAKHFDAVISADAARTYKPDPRVYALAPAALNLTPDQILFVSANAWDAVGAKRYGFRVAWCNRTGQTRDTHGPAPDLEIRTLDDLAEALRR